ncbi:MAG: serine hydrolase domain-containing protein, partial [Planctomycetaceae bacterium]
MRRASDCLRADAVLAGLIVALVATAARGQGADRFDWPQASPESQGMSAERLAALKDALARDATHGFLVIRNDKIVCEWYAEGRSTRDKLGTASLAKALVGGMSLAVALSDGLISLDDKAARYVPQWKDDRLKSEITIRNLGSHTSGLKDSQNEEGAKKGLDQYKLPGWEGDFWRWTSAPAAPGKDAFTISRDLAPIVSPPGTEFHYSNPGIGMLTWCVTASLKGTKAPDIRMLLRERVMRPIGVPDDEWACGYDRTEVVDRLPLVASWGGASFSPRAIARIGRLVLREGDWEGTRVLSRDAVRQVATDAGLPGHCGMGWWTNRGGRFGRLPQDALWGAGAGHRVLFIVPSLNLIVVRMGGALSGTPWGSGFYEVLEQHFVNPLMDCFAGKNASSESPAKGACADPLPPTAAQRASPLPLDGGGVGGGGVLKPELVLAPPPPPP